MDRPKQFKDVRPDGHGGETYMDAFEAVSAQLDWIGQSMERLAGAWSEADEVDRKLRAAVHPEDAPEGAEADFEAICEARGRIIGERDALLRRWVEWLNADGKTYPDVLALERETKKTLLFSPARATLPTAEEIEAFEREPRPSAKPGRIAFSESVSTGSPPPSAPSLREIARAIQAERDGRRAGGADDCYMDNADSRRREYDLTEQLIRAALDAEKDEPDWRKLAEFRRLKVWRLIDQRDTAEQDADEQKARAEAAERERDEYKLSADTEARACDKARQARSDVEKRLEAFSEFANTVCDYDAGLLNNHGGGNVDWWFDYIRAEVGRANSWWRTRVEDIAALLAGGPENASSTGRPERKEEVKP